MNVFSSHEEIDKHFPDMSSADLHIAEGEKDVSNSGKAGNSVRLRERVELVNLTNAEQEKYYAEIPTKTLYHDPTSIPVMTGENLFAEESLLAWDIGCGRGERLIDLAKKSPDKKFVGVDIHARSLYLGVRAASLAMLDNVKFLRADASFLFKRVPDLSAEEVALLFPAPQPKSTGGFNDILSDPFALDIARSLPLGNVFEFATDSEPYFNTKMRGLAQLGIVSCESDDLTHRVEAESAGAPTRYQLLWEKKGIPTHRALMRPVR